MRFCRVTLIFGNNCVGIRQRLTSIRKDENSILQQSVPSPNRKNVNYSSFFIRKEPLLTMVSSADHNRNIKSLSKHELKKPVSLASPQNEEQKPYPIPVGKARILMDQKEQRQRCSISHRQAARENTPSWFLFVVIQDWELENPHCLYITSESPQRVRVFWTFIYDGIDELIIQ